MWTTKRIEPLLVRYNYRVPPLTPGVFELTFWDMASESAAAASCSSSPAKPLRLCEKGWPSRVWYLPHLPLFYPGLEIQCIDLLNSIHETIECDFWLDDIGVSLVSGKIEPPRCKNAMMRLESECIYFTAESINGPLPNFDSVSPTVMSEISRILGWGPWGSSPRDRKKTRRAWLFTSGTDKRCG